MKSLGRATTRDLGIAENFQLAQQSPFSPAEDLTRQARGRAFLGSHKADTNTTVLQPHHDMHSALNIQHTAHDTRHTTRAECDA